MQSEVKEKEETLIKILEGFEELPKKQEYIDKAREITTTLNLGRSFT